MPTATRNLTPVLDEIATIREAIRNLNFLTAESEALVLPTVMANCGFSGLSSEAYEATRKHLRGNADRGWRCSNYGLYLSSLDEIETKARMLVAAL